MRPERELAMKEGKLHYSGHPCRVIGHGGLRYVSTGGCVECLRGSQAERDGFKQLRKLRKEEERKEALIQAPNMFRAFRMPDSYSLVQHADKLHAMLLNNEAFGRLLMWALDRPASEVSAVIEGAIGVPATPRIARPLPELPPVLPRALVLTGKAGTGTIEAFRGAGWTDDAMVEHGYAEWK